MTQPTPTPATPAEPATPQNQTFTQADLDRIVSDRLARERGKYADYDQLKTKASEFDKLAEAQKTEAQKLSERVADAERKAATAELKALRVEVAATKGLTPAQAKRLHGSTKEELEADADELVATFGATKPDDPRRPVENLRPGALPAGEPGSGDPNEWMRKRASRT